MMEHVPLRDRLRFAAQRVLATATRQAQWWVPDFDRVDTFPAGAPDDLRQALVGAHTAREVRAILARTPTLSLELLDALALGAGVMTPALARWLVVVQPSTAALLAQNQRLSHAAGRAAAEALRAPLADTDLPIPVVQRRLLDLVALEQRFPGAIPWDPALTRLMTVYARESGDLWLAMAGCARASDHLVSAAWPVSYLWKGTAPVEQLMAFLSHPRRPPDCAAWLQRRLSGKPTPPRNLVIATVRAAEGADRLTWWRSAFAANPVLTLLTLAEHRLSALGCFAPEELLPYLKHEQPQVRLAAICLMGLPPARSSAIGDDHDATTSAGPAETVGTLQERAPGPRRR